MNLKFGVESVFLLSVKIIMYSTDLEEICWQVIKKILNVQERKREIGVDYANFMDHVWGFM